jgi:hypothetical protein
LFFVLYDHLKLVFIFFRFIHSHKPAKEEEEEAGEMKKRE